MWIYKWVDKCKLSFLNGNDCFCFCFFRLVGGLIYWLVGCEWVSWWVSEQASKREGDGERQAGAEGGREVGWYTGAKNDHFINVRLSLDRVLTTQFDWFEVFLVFNYVDCVPIDQLSTVIIQFDLVICIRTTSINAIWTCLYVPSQWGLTRLDNGLSSRSHIRMPIVYQRCMDKSFTTKYAITFLIFLHFDTSIIQIRKCKV